MVKVQKKIITTILCAYLIVVIPIVILILGKCGIDGLVACAGFGIIGYALGHFIRIRKEGNNVRQKKD